MEGHAKFDSTQLDSTQQQEQALQETERERRLRFYQEARERYGLPETPSPKEAFDAFMREYGDWVEARAYGISVNKRVSMEDVRQVLLTEAWVAATDKDYDSTLGKTLVGYIHQRVYWYILKAYQKRPDDAFLEEMFCGTDNSTGIVETNYDEYTLTAKAEDILESLVTQEDQTLGVDSKHGDMMAGSRLMGRVENDLEISDLIDKVISVVEELPSKYSAPIIEVLRPSQEFQSFLERKRSSNEHEGKYANAVRFEHCTNTELFEFTSSDMSKFDATKKWLLKRLPELREVFK